MNRYQRQTIVAQIGATGQQRLRAAHVAIVGVGGLGSPVGLYLAGAGVGKLTLVDHDTVSLTNLHRQVLYREHDVGKSKATMAKAMLSGLNGDIQLCSHTQPMNADNIERLLAGVDVIVDAADNFAISYLLSDFAHQHRKSLVSASVMQTSGYVGVYCYATDRKAVCPSLRAVFPQPPHVGQDCNSAGVVGTAAGMVGLLQAQEVIKVIVEDTHQLAGRLLSIDCWTYRQSIMDFNHAPEPERCVNIIAESELSDGDWIVDVRSLAEVQAEPKHSHQHSPMPTLDISQLPHDKRLVFVCQVGQRALVAADAALQAGYRSVAVYL